MANCLVQEYTDLQSPNTTSPSYSFAVEVEALSIAPEHLPDAICRELSGPGQVPSEWVAGTVDDAEMSNEEFKDLGDALASILASPSPQNSLSAGTPNRQSVIDGVTTAITTPRRGSEELCNGATEPLNSLSPLLSVDETALPAHSPLSSSLASCSSYEDIENSPQSTSQDIEDASETEAVSTTRANTRRKNSASSDSDDENAVVDENKSEKVIKLPQRKGGMQLWQFLYALLSDPQYKELIEWTSNVKEREFRLHEPESIAIWWGDHKNKRNMSYDKLSRSLRYYYDKGIIRKINGQRYVYRFCVAPEVMYRHIGNSDCRPRLKPMSVAAQNAMSKYNNCSYQMCPVPPHSVTPGAMFNGQFIPAHYPSLSCNYSPFGSTTNMLPPHSSFNQTFCASPEHEYGSFPVDGHQLSYGADMKANQFQPHHLSPVQRYRTHLLQNTCTFAGHNVQDCLSMTEDAKFQVFMSDNTPSPQPISPTVSSSQLSPSAYSPLPPPPPYNYGANPWDSFHPSPSTSH